MVEEGKVIVEKGALSPTQMTEVETGEYVTIKEIATRLRYSPAWITYLVQTGRIQGMKPLGRQWRIPKSEWQRLTTEGVPPLPREKPEKTAITEIEVPEDKIRKVAPEAAPKKEGEKGKVAFPIDFGGLFGR